MRPKIPLPLLLALVVIASLAIGAVAGRIWLAPETSIKTYVNSQTILTALRDQGFLVTQTYVFDQPVTINKTTGNPFKDFFVGQTVEARGTMEANLGLDLAKLSEEDITVTETAITVRIPSPSLFNTNLVGPIEVKNTQGIIKKFLQPDDGYNLALQELTKAATDAATQPDIVQQAERASITETTRLVQLLTSGSGKSVNVEIKK
ncbi:MAG TPA: DUF4230 domain-containing protein [Verrucomicrobiae bacterium]|nr:DUF4230 domain-containing protein [Verrucomicrobiae bacterium]